MRRIICTLVLVICLVPAISWALPVTVFFEPANSVVDVGDILSVELKADIPDPVLGWGLDINFDSSILAQLGPPVIGPTWFAALAPDGDFLAGSAFPTPVSGDDILLATLSFEVLTLMETSIVASITPGDLTEGFPLAFPAPPGSFAEVHFEELTVQPVPEPSTMLLVGTGLIGLTGFRRKFRN